MILVLSVYSHNCLPFHFSQFCLICLSYFGFASETLAEHSRSFQPPCHYRPVRKLWWQNVKVCGRERERDIYIYIYSNLCVLQMCFCLPVVDLSPSSLFPLFFLSQGPLPLTVLLHIYLLNFHVLFYVSHSAGFSSSFL